MWAAGEIVLKRSIYRANVRWTFPHRYVGEWNGRHGLYCGPGNRFERPHARHSIDLYWTAEWELVGWYLNLQAETIFNGRHVDTTDQALDTGLPWDWHVV